MAVEKSAPMLSPAARPLTRCGMVISRPLRLIKPWLARLFNPGQGDRTIAQQRSVFSQGQRGNYSRMPYRHLGQLGANRAIWGPLQEQDRDHPADQECPVQTPPQRIKKQPSKSEPC
jgi:hypothetical protein